ncbi:MAG: S41 family peptidase [Chitinophagales bacterium]|nr:S41 family peptidase [Chitinophagales bacterium]
MNKKLQVWLPLIFAVVMVVGMFFGYQMNGGSSKSFFSKPQQSTLDEVIYRLKNNYVDSINLDSLEGVAIEQMMNELDPHSVYFPPVELQAANEDLAGKFEGIGVEFNVFGDTVNIVYVIPNGPSDKAGLKIGDKILKVNDSSLVNGNQETEQIKKLIKGERGSKAVLQILREGKVSEFTVIRGTIPIHSIDAAYMLDKTTGYIKLNKFSESSYEEFMQAMERLQKEGLQKLVYDLRGNGGGFMNEAVDMADEFLDNDKLIVYTEGVNSKKREYRCKRPGLFEKGKLTILIDELSASASEVLAGALQDWDRATIIGRRSFGKGLVQEQYGLSDGSAIRLTVARYYTPLGRSIQRPYEKGRKVYMDELWERYSNGELLSADSNKVSNGKQYKTIGGKTVYGGGGIMPDIFVALDTSTYQRSVNRLLIDGGFNSFVYNYYLQHRQQVDQYATATEYAKGFTNGEEMWNGLVNYAAMDSINLKGVGEKEKQSLRQRLKALLARYKWRNDGFYQVLNMDDEMVKKALDTMAK